MKKFGKTSIKLEMFLLDHPSTFPSQKIFNNTCPLIFDLTEKYNIIFPEEVFYYDQCFAFDLESICLFLTVLIINTLSHLTMASVSNLVLNRIWKKIYSYELGKSKKFEFDDPQTSIQIVTKNGNRSLLYSFFLIYYVLVKFCSYGIGLFLYFLSFLILPVLSTLMILSFGWKKSVKANFLPEIIYLESNKV